MKLHQRFQRLFNDEDVKNIPRRRYILTRVVATSAVFLIAFIIGCALCQTGLVSVDIELYGRSLFGAWLAGVVICCWFGITEHK